MEDRNSLNYVTVVKLNQKPPADPITLFEHGDLSLRLDPGPLEFHISVTKITAEPPAVSVTSEVRNVSIPKGTYAVLVQHVEGGTAGGPVVRRLLTLRSVEAVSLLELRFQGSCQERVYEGFVVQPKQMVMWPEDPQRLIARPDVEPAKFAEALGKDFGQVYKLPDPTRGIFQLATRWFSRGLASVNRVDRYLCFWTVLEIYPGVNTSEIPRVTSEFLASHLCAGRLASNEVKERLDLGRICGIRDKIVHDGWAFVPADREAEFDRLSEILEKAVIVVLRLLGGLPPGDELSDLLN